jgi:hypothetical protein
MSEQNRLKDVRGSVLGRIERSERNYRLAFISALAVEGLFFVAFFLLADFSNRLHVLVMLAAVAVYLILGLGLFALGAHVSRNTQLVLKAIELLDEEERTRNSRK